MKVLLFSWHHLTGYITRLDIRQDDLGVVHNNLEDSHRPIQIRRSQEFYLKDADQRVEFLVAIISTCFRGLMRYSAYKDVLKDLCGSEI